MIAKKEKNDVFLQCDRKRKKQKNREIKFQNQKEVKLK